MVKDRWRDAFSASPDRSDLQLCKVKLGGDGVRRLVKVAVLDRASLLEGAVGLEVGLLGEEGGPDLRGDVYEVSAPQVDQNLKLS